MFVLYIVIAVVALVAGYMLFAYRKVKNMPVAPDNPKIRTLTEKNFNQQISKGITLVDFWAPWCMPCKMMVPVLNEVAAEAGDSVTVAKLNIDEHQAVAQKFAVRSIPTIVIFRNGKEVDRIVGVKQKDFLLNKINMLKYK